MVIIDQLLLYQPAKRINFNSSRGHSVSWHQLSGTLCLQLRRVMLPLPFSRHIWKL